METEKQEIIALYKYIQAKPSFHVRVDLVFFAI